MKSKLSKWLILLLAALLATGNPAPTLAQEAPVRVIHTPWLALRFVEEGSEVPLANIDTLTTQVELARKPFTIVFPTRSADDTYWLAAWNDTSIFETFQRKTSPGQSNEFEKPPFFGPGTGMADTAASSGHLTLNLRGHHHLSGMRLGPDPDRHVFFVSALSYRDEANRWITVRIEEQRDPLYLVAYYDEDGDGDIDHGEYEFIVLNFATESN